MFTASVPHLTTVSPKAYFFPTCFVGLIKDITSCYYNLAKRKKKKSTMEGQLHFLFLVANSVVHYRNLALTHFVKSQKQKPLINFQRHIQSNLSIKQVWALPGQSAETHRGCWDRLVLSQEKQSTNPPVSLPHRKAPGLHATFAAYLHQ